MLELGVAGPTRAAFCLRAAIRASLADAVGGHAADIKVGVTPAGFLLNAGDGWPIYRNRADSADVAKEWTMTKERSAQKRIAIYLRVSTGE
jgi:hypothetical protein